MVEIALVEQWVSIISGAATVAVVYFLWRAVKQMELTIKMSRKETVYRFRPWVGPSTGIEFMRTTPEGKQQFFITLKNYGELPASNVTAMCAVKNKMPTRDTLRNSDNVDKFSLGPLLPRMEKRYWFHIDSDNMQKAKDGDLEIFVTLYFAYEFVDGRSGYGMISHFDMHTNTFVHEDMWVD